MPKVIFAKGKTINTGNYQSTRLDISVELECTEAELAEKYLQAKDFVEERLSSAEGDEINKD